MMKIEHKIIAVSLFFGLSVWIIDAVLDRFIFYEGTFLDLLILNIPQHELYIRCVIVGFFLMFGLLLSRVISKHRKVEEELKESEKKYRSLFSQMLNGFAYCKIVLDDKNQPVDFIYLEINEAFEKLTGLKKEDVLNKKVTEAIPDIMEATPELFDIYGKVALTGKGTSIILDFTPLDIWLNISVYSPQKGYFVALFENITERKKIEEELHQYEHIVSSSTDMMALIDNQFKYLAANKAYMDAFNLISEKLVGQTILDLFGKKVFEKVIKPHAEKCLSGRKVNYQDWLEFPVQGRKYMDVTYSPYLSVDNEIKGFVVNARDISERRKAEEELENVFNLSPNMIGIFTTEGGLLKVNPSWEKVLGYTQKELLDMGWTKLVHPEDVESTNKKVEKQLKGSSVVNFINRYKCKDGSYKTLEWQASFAEEGIVHATARDITERKKAEEQLEKSQKELKKLTAHLQTVREEERTLVAHELHDDIGQGLSALKMDIYMLEKKLPKDQKDTSDRIKDINDLLDKTIQTTRKIYSELRPALLEYFSLKEVLEDQLNTFKELNNFSGDADIDLGGTELKEEDSIAIYRIVQEALNNIRWHSQGKTVNFWLNKTDNYLELTIKDDGIGIKKEDLNKPNSFGIIGMNERTSFLGGEIKFKGLPEKGTTVTVKIPINSESSGTGSSNKGAKK